MLLHNDMKIFIKKFLIRYDHFFNTDRYNFIYIYYLRNIKFFSSYQQIIYLLMKKKKEKFYNHMKKKIFFNMSQINITYK
jgi:hypothetical protein